MKKNNILRFSIEILEKFGEPMKILSETMGNIFNERREKYMLESISTFLDGFCDYPPQIPLYVGNSRKQKNITDISNRFIDASAPAVPYQAMPNSISEFVTSGSPADVAGETLQQMGNTCFSGEQIYPVTDMFPVRSAAKTLKWKAPLEDEILYAKRQSDYQVATFARNTKCDFLMEKIVTDFSNTPNRLESLNVEYGKIGYGTARENDPETHSLYKMAESGKFEKTGETALRKRRNLYADALLPLEKGAVSGRSKNLLLDRDIELEDEASFAWNRTPEPVTGTNWNTTRERSGDNRNNNPMNIVKNALNTAVSGGQTVKNINITINDGLVNGVQNYFNSSSDNPDTASNFMGQLTNALQMIVSDVLYADI